jgi:hypothetical protein
VQRAWRTLGTLGFALLVSAAIYWSYEGMGLDPAFPIGGELGDFGSFYEMGAAALRGDPIYGVYPHT